MKAFQLIELLEKVDPQSIVVVRSSNPLCVGEFTDVDESLVHIRGEKVEEEFLDNTTGRYKPKKVYKFGGPLNLTLLSEI